ncbi:hypothetical protein BVC80_8621g8 [Macleaya cordata]|uniref:Retrotransposon Copia-like N-terminal domain-containing protein n=1 Tax=Macleaya cordata TaxID=56857 RepID=A0A200PYI1_MACCD|nr:hypothetical protein BVC80_8621g8 [Macleaya cordata]
MAGPTSPSSASSSSSSSRTTAILQATHVNNFVSVKLDPSNYLLWRTQFQPLLRCYRLQGFVDGTNPCPPRLLDDGKLNPAYELWIEQDSIILGWIFSTLSDPVLAQLVDIESSRDAWEAITNLFASKTEARQMQLQKELQNLRKGDSSMQDYLLRAKGLSDQLAACGNRLSISNLKQLILQGLESSYDSIVTSLQTTMTLMSFEDFQSHLLTYELRLQSQQAILPTPATIHVASSNKNRPPPRRFPNPQHSTSSQQQQSYRSYNQRNNRGPSFQSNYQQQQQPHFQSSRSPNYPPNHGTCQLCGRRNHTVFNCWHRFDPNFRPSSPSPLPSSSHSAPPQAYVAAPSNFVSSFSTTFFTTPLYSSITYFICFFHA